MLIDITMIAGLCMLFIVSTALHYRAAIHIAQTRPPIHKGLVCAIGKKAGFRAYKQIGRDGGSITSADGRVQIIIPQGALAKETTIEVQPISNTNPAGNGLAYRLTPHGIQFKKPVGISFSYAADKKEQKIAQLQGIAYQDENGIWKSIANGSLDTVAKKVTVYVNHFSDWSQFESIKLTPENPVLVSGQSCNFKAVQYFDDEDLLSPLGGQRGLETSIGSPHDLAVSKIKTWRLSGVGSLKSSGQQAAYKAPAMFKGSKATAAVSLELNTKEGQVLLISSITVVKEGITFRIDGGNWIQFTEKECNYDDTPNRIYAKDSLHANAMIDWPEQVYPHNPWTTTAEGLSPSFVFHTERNFTNYYSIITVGEAAEEMASPGFIEFYHFPMNNDDYVSGSFVIEKGDKYDARGKKLAEVKIEGYFYVRTKKK